MADFDLKMNFPPEWVARLVAALTLAGLLPWSVGYYELLQLLVTGYAAYVAVVYIRKRLHIAPWIFGFLAVLYNPFYPVTMEPVFRGALYVVTTLAILIELQFWRKADRPGDLRSPNGQGRDDTPAIEPLGAHIGGELTRFLFDVAKTAAKTGVVLYLVFTAASFASRNGFELPGLGYREDGELTAEAHVVLPVGEAEPATVPLGFAGSMGQSPEMPEIEGFVPVLVEPPLEDPLPTEAASPYAEPEIGSTDVQPIQPR